MKRKVLKLNDDLKIEKMKMGKVLSGSPGPAPYGCDDDCSDWCAKDCNAGINVNVGTSFNWVGGVFFG